MGIGFPRQHRDKLMKTIPQQQQHEGRKKEGSKNNNTVKNIPLFSSECYNEKERLFRPHSVVKSEHIAGFHSSG